MSDEDTKQSWEPTMDLRVLWRPGEHLKPNLGLQQRWIDRDENGEYSEWRDVPYVRGDDE